MSSPKTVSTPVESTPSAVASNGETTSAGLPDVLTVGELAQLLRLNHKTVREAITRGEIPGVRRIGTTIRISRDAVVNWLNSGEGRVSHSKRSR